MYKTIVKDQKSKLLQKFLCKELFKSDIELGFGWFSLNIKLDFKITVQAIVILNG